MKNAATFETTVMAMDRETSPREKYVKRFEVVPPGVQPISTIEIPCGESTDRIFAINHAINGMTPNCDKKPMAGAFGFLIISCS